MSSPNGAEDVDHDARDLARGRIKSRLAEAEDSSGSDAASFSRTRSRSPDLFESGEATPVHAPESAMNGTSFQGYGKIKAMAEEDEADELEENRAGEEADDCGPEILQEDSDGSLKLEEQEDAEEMGEFEQANELSSLDVPEDEPANERPRSMDKSNSTPDTPDDTPSIRGSLLSSPSSSRAASRLSIAKFGRAGSLQPFERRFSARLSPSPQGTPRGVSPAFLNTHSRQTSVGSIFAQGSADGDGLETPQPPWEVVRWTKLKKVTGQLFSEAGRRNYGRATVIIVGSSIAVGTSKGLALVFDYHQNLTATIGLGTKAVESGAVTSLAISADHTTIATGHADGHIFTWELLRPAKPFLHIPPIERAQLAERKSDGHISGSAVVHVGFLGTRHTALVSADDGGMAFSHLATRGFGAVARVVKTTRLLGRYPSTLQTLEKSRRPSSVLAFAPLPLGNVEQPTDTLGLTALLTPYLLVIVSTTPIAETQFKSSRPKEIAPHGALSGCLAWFPAVKLKSPLPGTNQMVSQTKLVYCWSNILTVLEVHAQPSLEKDKPASLTFRPRSRWKSVEAIVAVQWLSRSVLAVMTISQRLIILEDPSLRVTDSFDLLYKHIFHQDLFSKQLRPVVEQLDENDTSMHGVVADAFHMAFRAYKGRLFLLGFNDVSIGTLSNWADRLMALMDDGDYIEAIRLATSYYVGDSDRITVGLPEDAEARHPIVREKLLEMLSASLRYTFSRLDDLEPSEQRARLSDLASVTFIACLAMEELDFLFENVYEAFEDASCETIFFEVLEPYVLDGRITSITPAVLRPLVDHYAKAGQTKRLEELICLLDTSTMDLHQTTTLCKRHRLYDALIYVWNSAIGDYVTPLLELLQLIKLIEANTTLADDLQLVAAAMKVFPYLAYTFTGRTYPGGVDMDEQKAHQAKAEAYGVVFSGHAITWPGSSKVFRADAEGQQDSSYPYLALILRFDTPSFMSMLNEAFEDHFLNGPSQDNINGSAVPHDERGSQLLPTRHTIISILLEVLGSEDFEAMERIYLDIFLARNLPKYPQFIMLPGSTTRHVLEGLCKYPTAELADDCQLSVEYLLSFYHPPDLQNLIPLFRQAEFFRVLKTVYRGFKDYPQLIQTYFEDPDDQHQVFSAIANCLRASSPLTSKQRRDVEGVLVQNAVSLASIDTPQTARTLQNYAPTLIEPVLLALEDGSHAQFVLLRTLLEPAVDDAMASKQASGQLGLFEETYVQLMCRHDPTHVADYVGTLSSSDLRLNQVLPAIERSGVVDAAVVLLAREGLAQEAMARLVKHLRTLENALTGLMSAAADSPDVSNTNEAAEDLIQAIAKYVKVGIWLCQDQTKATDHSIITKARAGTEISEAQLLLDERLWLELMDTIVLITKAAASQVGDIPGDSAFDTAKLMASLRSSVQQTFSALLTSTTRPQLPVFRHRRNESLSAFPNVQPHPTFLRILRAFLARAARSSPSLSYLRAVLAEIFAAYIFEETILKLANQFLDKDLFGHVDEAWKLRQRGWRPRANVCERCRNRAWGPGVGGDVYESWERHRRGLREAAEDAPMGLSRRASEMSVDRGKGRAESQTRTEGDEAGTAESRALIVFACRHVWHRNCLEQAMEETGGDAAEDGRLQCPLPHGHA